MPTIIKSWSWEEAFDKFGFGDGDGLVMTDVVAEVLTDAGYVVDTVTLGLHNVVIDSIKTAAGEELIPDKFDFIDDNPRDHLPEVIVRLLDSDPRSGDEVRP
jgi:hypothetical protein